MSKAKKKQDDEVPSRESDPPDGPSGNRRSARSASQTVTFGARDIRKDVPRSTHGGSASTSSTGQQNLMLTHLTSLRESIDKASQRLLQNPEDSDDSNEESDFISEFDLKTMFKLVMAQLGESRETNNKLKEKVSNFLHCF